MEHSIILSFVAALFISILSVPFVSKMAFKKGYLDQPNDRKIHTEPKPRIGGVAIFISCVVVLSIVVYFKIINLDVPGVLGILVGGVLFFAVGLYDDINSMSPHHKFSAQIIIALITSLLGVNISVLHNPFGDPLYLGYWAHVVTIIWIVGIANAINFIDGIDGLAGGVTTISAVSIGVLAFYTDQSLAAFIAAILAGSMVGFLFYNFYPARIFMGDSGSLLSGFLLATISVLGVLKTVTTSIILPVLILAVPIFDTLYAIIRRILSKQSIFKADANHIHHKLLNVGLSQRKTVLILYLVCIASGSIAATIAGAIRIYLPVIIALALILIIISQITGRKVSKVVKTS